MGPFLNTCTRNEWLFYIELECENDTNLYKMSKKKFFFFE